MTCLVALRHGRGALIGADSACSDGATTIRSRKYVVSRSVGVIFTGKYVAVGQLLQQRHRNPRAWAEAAIAVGVDGFAISFTECVGWDGKAIWPVSEYAALGSGSDLAIGAMHALRAHRFSPRATLLGGLRAAGTHSTDCIGPYAIISATKSGVRVRIVR